MNTLLGILLFTSVTALGCGGKIGTDILPAPAPTDPSITPATSFTSAQITAAAAQCSAPHGTVEPVPTIDRLYELLIGVWYLCPTTDPTATSVGLSNNGTARVGVEFTSDGHFYWLQADASGTVTRGSGLTEEGGYTFEPDSTPAGDADGLDPQLDVMFGDQSFMGTRATFESGPRRLDLEGFYAQYFVPMNGAE